MNRIDKALIKVNIHGTGIEVGPSFQPILPKSQKEGGGYTLLIMQHKKIW